MKRGRPRLLTPESVEIFRSFVGIRPDATTRTFHNSSYAGIALNKLCGSGATVNAEARDRWGWLLRPAGGVPHARMSIMYQLGRTRCDIALKIFADELCRLKPTAQEAIRQLRQWQEQYSSILAVHFVSDGAIPGDERRAKIALRITSQ